MTRPALPQPVRPPVCAGCGGKGRKVSPLCSVCQRTLQHVCYGKGRLGQQAAQGIGHNAPTPVAAYTCPVCRQWHVGNDSRLGRAGHADAVLICLRLTRADPDYLGGLAVAWAPPAADRAAWRAAVTAQHLPPRYPDRAGQRPHRPAGRTPTIAPRADSPGRPEVPA